MITVVIGKTIQKKLLLNKKNIQAVIDVVANAEQVNGSMSVQFIGRKKMKTLNEQYRGIAAPTDVLSFGLEGNTYEEETDFGDIFLCQEYIIEQAKTYDVVPKIEVARMLIHGTLHLLGYDHQTKKEATEMFSKQELYLEQIAKTV